MEHWYIKTPASCDHAAAEAANWAALKIEAQAAIDRDGLPQGTVAWRTAAIALAAWEAELWRCAQQGIYRMFN